MLMEATTPEREGKLRMIQLFSLRFWLGYLHQQQQKITTIPNIILFRRF